MKFHNSFGIYLFLIFFIKYQCRANVLAEKDEPLKHDFDIFIFTQSWPVSVCLKWKEKSHANQCTLPSPKEIWTIHGIWPTKLNTIGPNFCNHSDPFDINQIKPIQGQLEQFWMNVEKNTPLEQLWSHEWEKHGTCAAQLPSLDNENKYFGQGLKWLQKYSMSSLLSQANIQPGGAYNLTDIYDGLKSELGTDFAVECMFDRQSGKSYLIEIRICFTKELNLTDCDGILLNNNSSKGWQKVKNIITNCNVHKEIEYPSVVPRKYEEENSGWKFPFVNLYKLVKMLQWITL
ncbi:ribonuclease Oy [Culicoides brevitarsis]|uniref:ribonuclease Oy n=1 Tax=Culicoides brevitarsis TaxID=469753 RepID=UPI00307C9E27